MAREDLLAGLGATGGPGGGPGMAAAQAGPGGLGAVPQPEAPNFGLDVQPNLLEQAEELKSWPDARLEEEMVRPVSDIAPALVLAEGNNRILVRQKYQEKLAQKGASAPTTTAEDVYSALSGQSQPPAPEQSMMPPGGPPTGAPMGLPPGAGMAAPVEGPPGVGPPMAGPQGAPPMGPPALDPSTIQQLAMLEQASQGAPPGGLVPGMRGGGYIPMRGYQRGGLVRGFSNGGVPTGLTQYSSQALKNLLRSLEERNERIRAARLGDTIDVENYPERLDLLDVPDLTKHIFGYTHPAGTEGVYSPRHIKEDMVRPVPGSSDSQDKPFRSPLAGWMLGDNPWDSMYDIKGPVIPETTGRPGGSGLEGSDGVLWDNGVGQITGATNMPQPPFRRTPPPPKITPLPQGVTPPDGNGPWDEVKRMVFKKENGENEEKGGVADPAPVVRDGMDGLQELLDRAKSIFDRDRSTGMPKEYGEFGDYLREREGKLESQKKKDRWLALAGQLTQTRPGLRSTRGMLGDVVAGTAAEIGDINKEYGARADKDLPARLAQSRGAMEMTMREGERLGRSDVAEAQSLFNLYGKMSDITREEQMDLMTIASYLRRDEMDQHGKDYRAQLEALMKNDPNWIGYSDEEKAKLVSPIEQAYRAKTMATEQKFGHLSGRVQSVRDRLVQRTAAPRTAANGPRGSGF